MLNPVAFRHKTVCPYDPTSESLNWSPVHQPFSISSTLRLFVARTVRMLMRTSWDNHTWHYLRSTMQHEIALDCEETVVGCAVPRRLYALN